jgi:hypothetical protein
MLRPDLSCAGCGARAGLVRAAVAVGLVAALGAADARASADAPGEPIGVLLGPTREAGEWVLSYRYERQRLDGNRDGTDSVSTAEILSAFDVAPTDMDVEVHRLGVLYAPTDRLSLQVFLPIVRLDVDQRAAGRSISSRATDVGDLELHALLDFIRKGEEALQLHLGLSAPTGSIQERDEWEDPSNTTRLPYPYQIGSGTWDLLPAVYYRGRADALTWGVQLGGVFRLDENDNGYQRGTRYWATGWVAHAWTGWLSTSARVAWTKSNNVSGRDPSLEPPSSPAADPFRQAGHRIDLLPGVSFALPWLPGQRLAVEAELPVFQHLDGPQLERDWALTAGWQWAF